LVIPPYCDTVDISRFKSVSDPTLDLLVKEFRNKWGRVSKAIADHGTTNAQTAGTAEALSEYNEVGDPDGLVEDGDIQFVFEEWEDDDWEVLYRLHEYHARVLLAKRKTDGAFYTLKKRVAHVEKAALHRLNMREFEVELLLSLPAVFPFLMRGKFAFAAVGVPP
jgi:hypothetical protein